VFDMVGYGGKTLDMVGYVKRSNVQTFEV
jgi:hypothetical protein